MVLILMAENWGKYPMKTIGEIETFYIEYPGIVSFKISSDTDEPGI